MSNQPQSPISPWPRDEWICGDGASPDVDGARCEYLIHTRAPRFICRIVDEGGDEPEQEYDAISGLSYAQGDDFTLCEFVWLDTCPDMGGPLEALLERACDAIEASIAGGRL